MVVRQERAIGRRCGNTIQEHSGCEEGQARSCQTRESRSKSGKVVPALSASAGRGLEAAAGAGGAVGLIPGAAAILQTTGGLCCAGTGAVGVVVGDGDDDEPRKRRWFIPTRRRENPFAAWLCVWGRSCFRDRAMNRNAVLEHYCLKYRGMKPSMHVLTCLYERKRPPNHHENERHDKSGYLLCAVDIFGQYLLREQHPADRQRP